MHMYIMDRICIVTHYIEELQEKDEILVWAESFGVKFLSQADSSDLQVEISANTDLLPFHSLENTLPVLLVEILQF